MLCDKTKKAYNAEQADLLNLYSIYIYIVDTFHNK